MIMSYKYKSFNYRTKINIINLYKKIAVAMLITLTTAITITTRT